jgi:hypothetical protein
VAAAVFNVVSTAAVVGYTCTTWSRQASDMANVIDKQAIVVVDVFQFMLPRIVVVVVALINPRSSLLRPPTHRPLANPSISVLDTPRYYAGIQCHASMPLLRDPAGCRTRGSSHLDIDKQTNLVDSGQYTGEYLIDIDTDITRRCCIDQ